MIIKTTIHILNDVIYQYHSDKSVYIKEKANGALWDVVNSSLDLELEETDIPIEVKVV